MPAVGQAEEGQKLIQFLERRLALPWALLQRWIRTGQVRVNGKRSKPFEVLRSGDQVRVPPFALHMAQAGDLPPLPRTDSSLPPLLGAHNDLWAFHKPAGLAVQAGSRISESLAGHLHQIYSEYAFRPVPVHRLDKDTSGVILVAGSFQALKSANEWMRSGTIKKEYIAVVKGAWPDKQTRMTRHYLEMGDNVKAWPDAAAGRKEARCWIRPLVFGSSWTTLQISLGTGRKRQIRAQLAALGYPILGDARYGNSESAPMRLHAMRIILPDLHEFVCLPEWADTFGVGEVPVPISNAGLEENAPATC